MFGRRVNRGSHVRPDSNLTAAHDVNSKTVLCLCFRARGRLAMFEYARLLYVDIGDIAVETVAV